MDIQTARALRDQLSKSIDQAEASGASEISLTATLQAADDAARAELQAAIDAANNKGS